MTHENENGARNSSKNHEITMPTVEERVAEINSRAAQDVSIRDNYTKLLLAIVGTLAIPILGFTAGKGLIGNAPSWTHLVGTTSESNFANTGDNHGVILEEEPAISTVSALEEPRSVKEVLDRFFPMESQRPGARRSSREMIEALIQGIEQQATLGDPEASRAIQRLEDSSIPIAHGMLSVQQYADAEIDVLAATAPEPWVVRLGTAILTGMAGDVQNSKRHALLAQSSDPTSLDCILFRAQLLRNYGDEVESRKVLEAALADASIDARAKTMIMDSLANLVVFREPERAMKLYAGALDSAQANMWIQEVQQLSHNFAVALIDGGHVDGTVVNGGLRDPELLLHSAIDLYFQTHPTQRITDVNALQRERIRLLLRRDNEGDINEADRILNQVQSVSEQWINKQERAANAFVEGMIRQSQGRHLEAALSFKSAGRTYEACAVPRRAANAYACAMENYVENTDLDSAKEMFHHADAIFSKDLGDKDSSRELREFAKELGVIE